MSERRGREIVSALHAAGLLAQRREAERGGGGAMEPATYVVSSAGRERRSSAPVLVTDGAAGRITGIRMVASGERNDDVRSAIAASGLSGRAAAKALRLSDRMLRRMMSGEVTVGDDDPVLARLAELGADR